MQKEQLIFHQFPKIGHFVQASAVRKKEVNGAADSKLERDVTLFAGSVKLHGTNASIVWNANESQNNWYCQSRNQVLIPPNDNLEFRSWCESRQPSTIRNLMAKMSDCAVRQLSDESSGVDQKHDITQYTFVVYGEFCGRKIQKSVAISKLKKGRRVFVVFAVMLVNTSNREKNSWLRIDHKECRERLNLKEDDIYNIFDFPTFEVEIDWSSYETRQAALAQMKVFTDQVAKECPVAKQLENISGLGEGIVWAARAGKNQPIGKKFASLMFKTKSVAFDDTVRQSQFSDQPEISESMTAFVSKVATPQKFRQAWKESVVDFRAQLDQDEKMEDLLTRSVKDLSGFCPGLNSDVNATLGTYLSWTQSTSQQQKKIDKYQKNYSHAQSVERRRKGAFCVWFVRDVLLEQSEEIRASEFKAKIVKTELYHAAEKEFETNRKIYCDQDVLGLFSYPWVPGHPGHEGRGTAKRDQLESKAFANSVLKDLGH